MSHPALEAMDRLFGGAMSGQALSETDQARLETARGRAGVDAENIQANIARLESLMEKVGPEQRTRIARIVANLKQQLPGWTQPKTERRDPRENLIRGGAAAVANTLPWAADMLLTIPDLLGIDMAEAGRQRLQERAAETKEFFDPQGAAGLVGELGAGMAAGAPVYGPIVGATARAMGAASPAFARLAQAGAQGSRAAGAATGAIAGAPLNLLQAAGVDEGQRGVQLGIGTGADLIFGALMPGAQVPQNRPPGTGPAADAKAEIQSRDAVIESLKLKANAEASAKKEIAEARKAAKDAWTKANPDKEWKKVPEKERKELTQRFLEAARASKQPTTTPQAPGDQVVQPTTPAATPEQLSTLRSELARAQRELALNPSDAEAQKNVRMFQQMLDTYDPQTPPAPVATPAPAPVTPPAAPVGKSVQAAEAEARSAPKNPLVVRFMQMKELKQRYDAAGIPMDSKKDPEVLAAELSEILSARRPEVTREELEQTIATYKGRLAESPHMAPIVAELETQLRAMGGTPTSIEAVAPPEPQRASRIPEPTPESVAKAKAKEAAILKEHREGQQRVQDSLGQVLREDIYDPMNLDEAGNPVLLLPRGRVLQQSDIDLMLDRGLDSISAGATATPVGKVVGSIEPGVRPITSAPSSILDAEYKALKEINPTEEDSFLYIMASEELLKKGKTLKEVNALLKSKGIEHQWLMYPEGVTPPKGQEHLSYEAAENRIFGPKPDAAPTNPAPTASSPPPAVTQPSAEATPSPTSAPAVRKPAKGGKKARKGLVETDLLNYSSKELNKLDDQLMAKLDKLSKEGKQETQEYIDTVDLMTRVTNELNSREVLEVAALGDRPYESATPEQLLTLRDEAQAQVRDAGKNPPKALTDHLESINREINGRKSGIFLTPEQKMQQPVPIKPPKIPAATEPVAPVFDVKILSKKPSALSDSDLQAAIDEMSLRIANETDIDRVRSAQERLSRYMTEQAKRQSPPPAGPAGEGPMPEVSKIDATPAVTAFKNRPGFALAWRGGATEAVTDRLSRFFMWGLGSGGPYKGASFLRMRWKAQSAQPTSNLLPGLDRNAKKVVFNQEDLTPPKLPFLSVLRKGYQGGVRGTYGLNQMVQAVGKQSYPAEWNVAKLGAMMGRYIARTERFLTGTGRLTYEENGEPIEITNQTYIDLGLPVFAGTGDRPVTLANVLNMAEGDKTALGNLAVAFASLEGAGRGKMPMDATTAELLIRSADPKLVRAVQELRKYNLALMIAAHKAGRLSLEGLQAMAKEDWYTPFHRVTKQLDSLRNKPGTSITQPNPILGRKGSSRDAVLNPYDVAVEMTRRVLRANEMGMILNSFIDMVDSLPNAVKNEILVPATSSGNPKAMQINAMADQLRKSSSLSEADAKSMLAYIEGDVAYAGDKTYKDALIHVWRDGQIQTYRLKRPEIFEALKSLTPTEMDMFWRFMAMPARTAAKGVVYSPMFIARMAFIDSFQAFLGSKYGFRPGIDQFRGFWHAITRSKEYQKLLDVGGPATLQSLSYIDPAQAGVVSRTAGERVIDTVINNIKELKIVEAYKAIALPIAESARVGEALRALDHGASTIEAAFAAWDVVGNPRMQGSSALVRGFHQITMFSRPAMAAIDKLVTESGVGPVVPEYNKTATGRMLQQAGVGPRTAAAATMLTKAFVGITLPSLLIWYAQKDDEEIRKLRQTPTGQLFWFVRKQDGTIIKVRKPHLIGQVFGSSAEAFADAEYQSEDTDKRERLLQVLDAVFQDASVNTLPQLGVITYGLWANKAPGLGSPIVKRTEEQLNPALMGYDNASMSARIVADALEPVSSQLRSEALRRALSPAGLDYVVRNLTGMLGEDVVQGIGAAIEYSRDGFLPPKEELPVVGRLFARYPGMNIQPVQDFYRRDAKVAEVAKTIAFYEQHDPDKLVDYMTENYEYYRMVPRHREIRQMIANYRRAIEDVRHMPDEFATREKRLEIEKQLLLAIEARTQQMNIEFRETQKVTNQMYPDK